MLSAEIIAVGSELLTPDRTDTNSLWVTARLNEAGIDVMLKTIVGDDAGRIEETIRDAVKRADVVITTGGLGPTEDDLTRHVSAAAIGRTLVYHETLEADLRSRFRRYGREMPEINKRQAYVIDGAEILPNPNGSAVGMLTLLDSRLLINLPGPPRELQPMFENFVLPVLQERAGGYTIARRKLSVVGFGESALDEAIAPIYKTYPNVNTSILFSKTEIEIRLAARVTPGDGRIEMLDELARKLVEKLGPAVFSTDGSPMEQIVGRLLTASGATLAAAESCTGGLIAERLTDAAGASRYFVGGVAAYANSAKIEMLGVLSDTIEKFGAVSAQTAEEMARGVRTRFGADFGLSVTGIAGPDGGSDEKPVGTVYLGLADADGVKSKRLSLPGDRFLIRWRASQAALDLLRRRLIAGDRA